MTMLLLALLASLSADPGDAALMKSDDQAVKRGFTQQRRTLPAPFHGIFRNTLEECASAAPGGLIVGATRMTLPEADGDVQSVRVEGQRKVVVTSIYESSSDLWEKTESLLLSRDGGRLAVISPSGSATRVRCPAQ